MVLSGGKIRKNGRQLLLWNGNLRREAPSGDRVTGTTGKQGRCVAVGRLRGGSEMRFRCAGSLPSGEGERGGVRRVCLLPQTAGSYGCGSPPRREETVASRCGAGDRAREDGCARRRQDFVRKMRSIRTGRGTKGTTPFGLVANYSGKPWARMRSESRMLSMSQRNSSACCSLSVSRHGMSRVRSEEESL